MGYSSDRINIPEHLRAWHSSGLEYLLPSKAEPEATADSSASQSPGDTSASPAVELSDAWKAILAKSPSSPPVVWSYFDLGFDLSGQSDPKRSTMLKTLIAHLKWPKGSSGFIPIGLPENGAIVPDAGSYWQAVNQLGAHSIICLGTTCADVICPDHDGRSTKLVGDVTVHILPDLLDLANMLPHERLGYLDRLAEIRL